MRSLTVALGNRSYPIHIGPGLLDALPDVSGAVFPTLDQLNAAAEDPAPRRRTPRVGCGRTFPGGALRFS